MAEDPLDQATIRTAYYIGLRASEVGLIRFRQLDTNRGLLDIQRRKGSLGGVYPTAPIQKWIDAWLTVRPPTSIWLFPCQHDPALPLSRHAFSRIWRAAAGRAGIPDRLCHPHVLKHSVATHMLDRGCTIDYVQRWLGHKRTESTMVYAELTGHRKREGQEVVNGLMSELDGGTDANP